jgi:hypothetical protein
MTRFKLTSSRLAANFGLVLGSFALLTVLPGCPTREPTDDATASEGTSSGTMGASSTDPTVPTEAGTTAMTTTGETTAGSQTGTDSDAMTTTGTSVTTGEPVCGDPEPQALNAVCSDASGCGCESDICYVLPAGLGAFCGECKVDADCDGGGCTVPNPLAGIGSTCNQGEPGAGCETNEVCSTAEASLCGLLLSVPGLISVSTCGACITNDDCIAANEKTPNCSPTYNVMDFNGQYMCVESASVPNNTGCNLAKGVDDLPTGNAACESGFCGEASIMGLVKLGICGECESNADCVKLGKSMCSDATVDLNSGTLIGAVCT